MSITDQQTQPTIPIVTPAVQPAADVTPQAVYTSENIQQAITTPAAKPDFSDPFKVYDFYLNSPEIQAKRSTLQGIQSQILGLNQTLRGTIQANTDKTWNMNQMRGANVAASNKAALPLLALTEQRDVEQAALDALLVNQGNLYNIAKEERSSLRELIAQTGGKAGIKFTDTYEQAVSKAQKYIDEKAKEEKKQAYKDELKKIAKELGISNTKVSTKELEKKIAKKNKEALAEAKKLSDLKVQQIEMDIANTKSLIANRGSETTKLKTSYTDTEQRQMIEEAIAGGEDWNGIFQTFKASGIDTSSGSTMDTYLKQKFGY